MSKVVLDASAVLAFLRREPGHERVWEVLGQSLLCTVNATEVLGKLIDRGAERIVAERGLMALDIEFAPFSASLVPLAGRIHAADTGRRLSLGDRCCLALGLGTGLPVLTTDRSWKDLELGVSVELIR